MNFIFFLNIQIKLKKPKTIYTTPEFTTEFLEKYIYANNQQSIGDI